MLKIGDLESFFALSLGRMDYLQVLKLLLELVNQDYIRQDLLHLLLLHHHLHHHNLPKLHLHHHQHLVEEYNHSLRIQMQYQGSC